MQNITRETIRHLASSDTVYYRGMRYYAAGKVSSVTWNEKTGQYRGIVQGSNNYVVTIQPDEEGDITYSCNCPAHIKYSGACKHVVAALLFVFDYRQRENMKHSSNRAEQTAYQIIEYFNKREYSKLTPQYYHMKLHINIPEFLKENDSQAFVSFMAGADKMYKVASVKKFMSDYYEGNTIDLGKEFHYVSGECVFDDKASAVLNYFTELYEIQEVLGRAYYPNFFKRHEIVLSKGMLYRLLKLAEDIPCSLTVYGSTFDDVKILQGNPDLQIDLTLDNDIIKMKNASEHKLFSLCKDGSILYYNKVIYIPQKEFISNLLPLYSALFSTVGKSVEFKGDNKNNFIEKVLPVIKKTMNVVIPKEIEDSYVVEPLDAKLYLDINYVRKKYVISAKIKFCYGIHEINPLAEESTYQYIIIREREEEERLIKLLYELGFKTYGEEFILSDENDIFAMMSYKIKVLTDNFEVFYSKEYKKISVKKIDAPSANIRLNTDINLLKMDLKYEQIPDEELEEFFKSVRLRKKYYRLKNGAFIDLNLEEQEIKSLAWFLDNGEDEGDGSLKFAGSDIFYLENMLAEDEKVQKDENYKKLLEDITHPEKISYDIPSDVTAKLREYQVTGYNWLRTLSRYGMGGILADDMGLGKTLQTIVYISSRPKEKTLIVCPTSLSYNWQDEFERFAPHIRTCIITGAPEDRKDSICNHRDEYDVWISTYPLIRKDVDYMKELSFDNMFIDEAQYIKNPASLGSKAVKKVRASHRFALTGTPIENALSELWSIFDFIMPGFFGKYSKFSDQYEKPILREQDEAKKQELKLRIQPFILRRMKKDVLKDLPDKIETKRMSEMTGKQRKIYLSYLTRIQSQLRENDGLNSGAGRIQVLAALTRLRQICCHPGTFIENYSGGSGKLEVLMEQLPDILDAGHSVIIFSQFTSMLSIIADALQDNQIPYFYLAGSTKPVDRKRYVEEFNEGVVKVFLISLKAGGTGLNLTGADTVIHFDPWWNPAVEDQATDRAYRIGQKKKVHVIKYVMKDSIEEKIYELQKRKKMLSDSVIEAEEVFVNQLTKEEILQLFE